MKKIVLISLWLTFFASVHAAETDVALPYEIVINNRILAKVQQQTISVIDLMKKMDVLLNQNYPEYAKDTMARFQFYSSQWRQVLSQMIDNELILADAETKQVKIGDGDLRETIQQRFGPNIMSTLDKLGLTYEEARNMVHTDMLVQRMMWFKVNSKAIQSVNPKDIKIAYDQIRQNSEEAEEWEYQVVSIRSQNQELGEKIANLTYKLLSSNDVTTENLTTELSKHIEYDPSMTTIQISSEMKATKKDLSESHREVISRLTAHTFSLPILQKSRAQPNYHVHRIFFLKDYKKEEAPSFKDVSLRVENELINQAIQKEAYHYLQKLRKYYGYDEKSLAETVPENFEPFQLK